MTSIPPQAWAQTPGATKVMRTLNEADGSPRFVGGCVRNALLNRSVADVDIATTLEPQATIAALTTAGVKAIPTGLAHGTVTAVADGETFEVTTLRRDLATDGRHATVAFTQDWTADASRRDFTMNALYMDASGAIFDPVGQGLDDLRAGRVRFIGEAAARIKEDCLRILRFFRMHAWYGAGPLDDAGLRACAAHVDGLAKLSAERVQREMLKLLAAESPSEVLRAMAAAGVLSAVLPGPLNMARLEAMAAIERDTFTEPDPILRVAALLEMGASQSQRLAERWRLSNRDAERLQAVTAPNAPKIVCYMSIRDVRRTLYRIGAQNFVDLSRLRWAEDPKASNQMQWRTLIALAHNWTRPVMPLTGAQVLQAGVPAGPQVGRVLAEVEEWWIDADFTDDQFSLIERLKAIVQATI